MYCNELKLSSVLEEFSITSRFQREFKNAKIKFLKKISVLNAVFFNQIQVQMIANQPSRLEKHQTLDILLLTDFL